MGRKWEKGVEGFGVENRRMENLSLSLFSRHINSFVVRQDLMWDVESGKVCQDENEAMVMEERCVWRNKGLCVGGVNGVEWGVRGNEGG